jgi:feruloyl-CoA synthase
MNAAALKPLRPVDILSWEVGVDRHPSGSLYIRPLHALGEYPIKLTDRLDSWATLQPERIFLAKRVPSGEWCKLTYREFRSGARCIAQWLLNRGLTPEEPVVILSGNDLEHALLGVGAMYAGIPYAPISPAYSLLSADFGKLRQIVELVTPGLVFAADGAKFERAIQAVVPAGTDVVVTANPPAGRPARLVADLLGTPVAESLDRAGERITGDTVAKILFTSGSVSSPKGVINTQRMLCSNQEMLRTVFREFVETPPVICDWLPWNHTFGGNHNFGLVLYNGGTFYLDDGQPVEGAFEETARNLREISPTAYFNVPKGYEILVRYLRREPALRERFFSRLKMTFYAAAGLSQHVWDALDELAAGTCGERIRMLTGLGATETAPFALCASKDVSRAGIVGLPVPGVEMKLCPVGEKLEVRVRGPNVTPGFWRQPHSTRAAFDEEGYYRLGDAVRFIDEDDPGRGFLFDGRIAEDFKLSSGTWVSVGPLRTRFILHFAPYVKDVVIVGQDRDDVTALIFPDVDECRRLPGVHEHFEALLTSFAKGSTGSSNRIARAIVLSDPPSIDAGEITDKGSINQRGVIEHRASQVEELYAESSPTHVIAAEKGR